MLILILIDGQYLENVVSSFKKGSNFQYDSSSGSHHSLEQNPTAKFPIPTPVGRIPPYLLTLFEKPCILSTSERGTVELTLEPTEWF